MMNRNKFIYKLDMVVYHMERKATGLVGETGESDDKVLDV